MYGFGKAVADAVRSFQGGRLAAQDESVGLTESFPKENDIRLPMANPPSPRDHVLRPVSRFYRKCTNKGWICLVAVTSLTLDARSCAVVQAPFNVCFSVAFSV